MFHSRVGSGASLGQALALPTNITLGWKGMPGINTLAYYKIFVNYGQKSFIALGLGANVIQLFLLVIYEFSNEARAFVRIAW